MLRTILAAGAVIVSTAAIAQAGQTDFGGATPIEPQNWFTTSDYPALARIEHRSGVVLIAFDINLQGRVDHCRITESSTSADLDAKACELLTKRGRFKLPADSEGHVHATVGRTAVHWRL